MKKIAPFLLILLIFTLTSLREQGEAPFEGTIVYQVLNPLCPTAELNAPEKVIYSTKDGLHRIEEVGGTRPMIYFYSDNSPYKTVCFEWLGNKIAIQEEDKSETLIAFDSGDSDRYLKESGRKMRLYYDNHDQEVWIDENINAKMPWMHQNNKGEEVFPLRFSPFDKVECEYTLEFTSVKAKKLDNELFKVPTEYVFMEKTNLHEMFGEMQSTSTGEK